MSITETESLDKNALVAAIRLCVVALKTNGDAQRAAQRLCGLLPPGKSILKAEPRNGGRVIAFWLVHVPRTNPATKNPRYVDLPVFAAMLLMDLPGRAKRFWFEAIQDDGLLYYIRFGINGGGEGERIYLSRIVRETLPGQDTPFALDHHSYLYDDLMQTDSNPRLPPSKFGRSESIKLARRLFETNPPQSLKLTADEYEALLWELFAMWDRLRSAAETPAKQ